MRPSSTSRPLRLHWFFTWLAGWLLWSVLPLVLEVLPSLLFLPKAQELVVAGVQLPYWTRVAIGVSGMAGDFFWLSSLSTLFATVGVAGLEWMAPLGRRGWVSRTWFWLGLISLFLGLAQFGVASWQLHM